jgi:hypothetical protein
MQQQSGIINIYKMCLRLVQSVMNQMWELINYVLCIKQKVDEEDDADSNYIVTYDDLFDAYDNMPGPYDDYYDQQWNHSSYDGYDGYDN